MRKTFRHSYEYAKSKFEESGFILLEERYINARTKMRCICQCGKETFKTLESVINGQKCLECGYKYRNNRRLPYSYAVKVFEQGGAKLLSKEYRSIKEPLDYICPCGNKSKIALDNFRRGQRCFRCGIKKNSGENHSRYDPSLTEEDRDRSNAENERKRWSLAIKHRDTFTCKVCEDAQGGNLVSHHLEGFSKNKELRFEINNGVTLCEDCHTDFHKKYGFGNNTEDQFMTFVIEKGLNVEEVLSHKYNKSTQF